MKNQDIIKNQADAIQKFLSNEGVDLPRGKVLDMLARLTGDKEWNSLSKRLKSSAPGTEKFRYAEVLKELRDTLETGRAALDNASAVVDADEDEKYAYERPLKALEGQIERVDVLIAGEKLVKAEGVTLLEIEFQEIEGYIHFLVPASLDIEVFERKLCAWLEKKDKALEVAWAADDLSGKLDEVIWAWDEDAFNAEAVRLGAFSTLRTKRKLKRAFEG